MSWGGLYTPEAAKREQKRAERSALEELFMLHVRAHRLPMPAREVCLVPERKWRWDFVWQNVFSQGGVALEIEGGIWMQKSGHNTGAGIARDIEKHNAALERNWRVFRATGEMVKSGAAVEMMKRVLGNESRSSP